MATFNGERFINEQLSSFEQQRFQDWDLWVSDDGSSDSTKEILDNFAQTQKGRHSVVIVDGPGKGFARNFLDLTYSCQNRSDYYAFSDQDDIWLEDKLQRAVSWLDTINPEIPALYCSRTEIVDEAAKPFSPAIYTPIRTVAPSFENALVQSIAGGNTMVFNLAAKKIFEQTTTAEIPYHDWWLYLLISGVNGRIYYDPEPSLLYRQHRGNIVGSKQSFLGFKTKFSNFLHGQLKKSIGDNLCFLNKFSNLLSPKNQKVLSIFTEARKIKGFRGLRLLKQSNARRDGFVYNLALRIGIFIGKI